MSTPPPAEVGPSWRDLAFGEEPDVRAAAERLRPLGFAEIIDAPFAVVRHHAGRVAVVVAVAAVLPLVAAGRWATAMAGWLLELESAMNVGPTLGTGPQPPQMSDAESLAWLLASLVGASVMLVGATRVLLADQVGVRLPALAALTRRPLRLLVVAGWLVLASLVAFPVLFVALALLGALGAFAPGLLVVAVPGVVAVAVYALGAFGLGPTVAAAERGGPLRAFARAVALSRGARWRLGGIFLAISLVSTLVVYSLVGLLNLIGLVGLGLQGPETMMVVMGIAGGLSYIGGLALIAPVSAMTYATAYLDRLVRHDGMDVLALLEASGAEDAAG